MILRINSNYSPDCIKRLVFAIQTLYLPCERETNFEILLRIISGLTVPIEWAIKGRGAFSRG